jgi:hypothetical protein
LTSLPSGGQKADITWKIIPAHHVEDHINALAAGGFLEHVHEVLFAVIDGFLCAEFLASGAFFGGSGGDEDPAPSKRPIWIAVVPMPLVPPWMSRVSPL